MSVSENAMMLMTISPESRSVSPLTPSPSREMRGIRLFRAISRKLARRSQEDLTCEEDSRSSSTDSSSSTHCSRKKLENSCSGGSGSVSPHHSSSSSESGSDRPRHTHSTSAESIRKVFQNLTVNVRSKSCNNSSKESSKDKRKNTKKTPPKKILRSPVTYTYVKGLSGLPTQRIPKNQSRVYLSNCGCGVQHMAALNR
ncbi:PREDICTED: uncharacterized protein LOC108567523 [Nicrophorus vespilloides]|uniref:Uncharacterized protein LOC108567523 n=1 Tax=Nicrophorus vespilloides TaxID=110193 RepID=A0ABM1N9M3_NICVS|nr:PREDICTED: uncharacterized protein LOC108567523 [Nicrophorus vespilloides]